MARSQETISGDGAAFVRNDQLVGVAWIAVNSFRKSRTRGEANAEDRPSMMNNAAWPKQSGPDGPDIRFRGSAQHFLQPSCLGRFDAVAHDEQKFAPGMGSALVDQLREVEASGHRRHFHTFRFNSFKVVERLKIRSVVIDDNHFMVVEAERPLQRFNAWPQQVDAVSRWDEERDFGSARCAADPRIGQEGTPPRFDDRGDAAGLQVIDRGLRKP